VIESLAAKRSAQKSAATRTLHEEIERCAKLAADEAAQRLDQIARLLATHAPQMEGDALSTAAGLAERILAAPRRFAANGDRLRNCHIVLKEEASRRVKQQARSPDSLPKGASNERNSLSERATALPSPVTVPMAPLPGGRLAAAPSDAQLRQLPKQAGAEAKPLRATATIPATIPATMPAGPVAASRLNSPSHANATAGAMGLSDESVMAMHGGQTAEDGDNQGDVQGAIATSAEPVTEVSAMPPMPRDLTRLLAVAQRVPLGGGPPSAAHRVDFALLGINEHQLKLARGAIDRDPRIRREVVEALPSLDIVDARRWLLWFSYDRDADVRRAAIALLATSSDPQLKKRVREAAESDADARVRQQAQAALRAP
jgi:hypothetical protein